jgi:hypothetical protein
LHLLKVTVLSGCLFLAACAGKRSTTAPTDWVEVDNPYITMTKDAPDKIWVPRSYAEGGVPRATEVVKMGVDKVMPSKASPQTPSPAPATPAVVASSNPPPRQPPPAVANAPYPATPVVLKHRVVVLEIGQNGLLQTMQEQLNRAGIALVADPAQAMFLAQSAQLAGPEGKGSFAVRLQQDYNVNEVIYVSAAGLAPGKSVTAEVYDTMGGGLLRGFDAVIPVYKETDQGAKTAAVAEALTVITAKVKELFPNLPWYSRISAVNGNRAYITAGKEAGLRVGQTLKIYRGGKFMKGLGFAPGSKIGVLEVDGFVGPNAAFCAIKDGQGIEAADVVSSE